MAKGIMANSILNAAAGMLQLVTGFACSIIAARLLGPEANGIIAFSLWLAATGSLVAELGTGVLLMRMLPQLAAQGYPAARRTGFAAYLAMPTIASTITLAVIYALVFLESEKLHWAETAPSVALVTGILFLIQSIGALAKNYLIGEQQLGTFFRLTAVASVLQLVLAFGGAWFYGVEGALVGYAAGQVAQFVYTLGIIGRRPDRCDVPFRLLFNASMLLSAGYIIDSVFLNRIEILFLQQFWSVEAVGFYAVSLSLANLALQLPIQLTGSLLPYYSQRRHDGSGDGLTADVFSGVIRALSYITLPMSFGLAAISTSLVTTVFGEAFRPAGMIVTLLALSSPAYVFTQILTQYLLSIDKIRSKLMTGLVGSGVILVGCLAAVPFYGGEGAAAVRIVTFVVMSLIMIRLTGFGDRLTSLYRTLAKVALASIAVGVVAFGVDEAIGGPHGLIAAIALGALTYPLALRLLSAMPAEDGAVLLAMSGRLSGKVGSLVHSAVLFVCPGAEGASEDSGAKAPAEGAGREAALPVTFAGTIGLFQPEAEGALPRDAAVLLLSPWGFEELSTRKFYRILAERMADIGIASLRFDYPGTGDALGRADDPISLSDWEDSILAAADRLRALSGRKTIIVIAQGIGATLALRLGARLEGVAATALLAPAVNGRAYLREVALMSKVIDQGLGLREDQRDSEGVVIAGYRMPAAIAEELRRINVAQPETIAAPAILLCERPAKLDDTSLPDGLRAAGGVVRLEPFDGYDDLAANPTLQKMPFDVIARIVGWLEDVDPVSDPPVRSAAVPPAAPLSGKGFSERPVRFGANNNFHGIICLPEGPVMSSVLLLSTAYDRASGWGRYGTQTARELATHGIASLRFDSANAGDSPPQAGAPEQVLYTDSQLRGVIEALDLLGAETGVPLMLAGRCSGAYLAIRAASADPRIRGVVSVNPYAYYWDPAKPFDSAMQFVPRSLDDYGQRLARLETFRRLFSGDIDVPRAARNITIALATRLRRRLSPLLRMLHADGLVEREVRHSFAGFEERRVELSLIYAEGDVGLDSLHRHFGRAGEGLSAYRQVRLTMLPDTDHNLTPERSKRLVFAEILRLARAIA